jgi:hypothetical protein
MAYYSIRNWERHQHYRDRFPSWIKVYVALLDDSAFLGLPSVAQAQLLKLWLLASRRGNRLPTDLRILGGLIGETGKLHIETLLTGGWLITVEESASRTASTVLAEPEEGASTGALAKSETVASRLLAKSYDAASISRARPRGRGETETERETTPPAPIRAREDWDDVAIRLTIAANQAITARFGESDRPLLASSAAACDLAEWVTAESIPPAFAAASIARQVAAKADAPPGSMAYFRRGIAHDWASHTARAQAATAPPVAPLPSAGRPHEASIADQIGALALVRPELFDAPPLASARHGQR